MLSKQTFEILIDLVEIKLSAILVQDKEDLKEIKKLKACRSELLNSQKLSVHNVRNTKSRPDLSKSII